MNSPFKCWYKQASKNKPGNNLYCCTNQDKNWLCTKQLINQKMNQYVLEWLSVIPFYHCKSVGFMTCMIQL